MHSRWIQILNIYIFWTSNSISINIALEKCSKIHTEDITVLNKEVANVLQ